MDFNSVISELQQTNKLLAEVVELLGAANKVRQEGEFTAVSMSANIMDGKIYWSVKGGEYLKHGATIYPEALDASGFNYDEMDVRQVYDLKGWTARYTVRADGSKPKVSLLVPPASKGSRPRQTDKTAVSKPKKAEADGTDVPQLYKTLLDNLKGQGVYSEIAHIEAISKAVLPKFVPGETAVVDLAMSNALAAYSAERSELQKQNGKTPKLIHAEALEKARVVFKKVKANG